MAPMRDFSLAGTPFRAIILKGPYSLLAYLGVPSAHWLADMDDLHFECHRGITYRDYGNDEHLPKGWYWYGWDYAHAGDRWDLSEEVRQALREAGALNLFDSHLGTRGNVHTIETVELDLVQAGHALLATLEKAEAAAAQASTVLKSFDS